MEVIHSVLTSPTENVLMTTTKQVQMRYLRSMFDVFWVWNRARRYIYSSDKFFKYVMKIINPGKNKTDRIFSFIAWNKTIFCWCFKTEYRFISHVDFDQIDNLLDFIFGDLVTSEFVNYIYSSNLKKICNKIQNSFYASIAIYRNFFENCQCI